MAGRYIVVCGGFENAIVLFFRPTVIVSGPSHVAHLKLSFSASNKS